MKEYTLEALKAKLDELKQNWELFQKKSFTKDEILEIIRRYTEEEPAGVLKTAYLNLAFYCNQKAVDHNIWDATSSCGVIDLAMLPTENKLEDYSKRYSHVFSLNSWYEYNKLYVADVIQPVDWEKKGIKHHVTVISDLSAEISKVALVDTAFKIAMDALEAMIEGKRILIHCKSGRARGGVAAVLAHYILERHVCENETFKLDTALTEIQKVRRQLDIDEHKYKLAQDAVEIIDQFYVNKTSDELSDEVKPLLNIYNNVLQLHEFKSLLINRYIQTDQELLKEINNIVAFIQKGVIEISHYKSTYPLINVFCEELEKFSNNKTAADKPYENFIRNLGKNILTFLNYAPLSQKEFFDKLHKKIMGVNFSNDDEYISIIVLTVLKDIISALNDTHDTSDNIMYEKFYNLAISPVIKQLRIKDTNKDKDYVMSNICSFINIKIDKSFLNLDNMLAQSRIVFVVLDEIMSTFSDFKPNPLTSEIAGKLGVLYAKRPSNLTNNLDDEVVDKIKGNKTIIHKTALFQAISLECMLMSFKEEAELYTKTLDYIKKPTPIENVELVDYIIIMMAENDKLPRIQFFEILHKIFKYRLITLMSCNEGNKGFYRKNLNPLFKSNHFKIQINELEKIELKSIISKTIDDYYQDNTFKEIYYYEGVLEYSIICLRQLFLSKLLHAIQRIELIMNNLSDWARIFNLNIKDLLTKKAFIALQSLHLFVMEKHSSSVTHYQYNVSINFDLVNLSSSNSDISTFRDEKANCVYTKNLCSNLNQTFNAAFIIATQAITPAPAIGFSILRGLTFIPLLKEAIIGIEGLVTQNTVEEQIKISKWASSPYIFSQMCIGVTHILQNIKAKKSFETRYQYSSSGASQLTRYFRAEVDPITECSMTETNLIKHYMSLVDPKNSTFNEKVEMLVSVIKKTYKLSKSDIEYLNNLNPEYIASDRHFQQQIHELNITSPECKRTCLTSWEHVVLIEHYDASSQSPTAAQTSNSSTFILSNSFS